MIQTKNSSRIALIDAMRAVAIVFVLLAHYNGGRISHFANRGCVQTFFFLSGLFAFSGRYNLWQYIKKQFQTLILPYIAFSVINILFHWAFNPDRPLSRIMHYCEEALFARRNDVMVAAMWFLPCLFFTSILYKCIALILKEHKYIVPFCFALSAVFKLWFEDPVYIFSINQGLKYLIYIALGGLLGPYIKQINDDNWKKLTSKQRAAAIFMMFIIFSYIFLLYKRGYVFWPQSVWALSLVYFINVVFFIAFVMIIAFAVQKIGPLIWIGQNTLGFCCLENINRALFNTAMAMFGLGFNPNTEIKAIVHVICSMCIGAAIILIINRICPQLLGKNKRG